MTHKPARLLLSSFAILTLSTAHAQTQPNAGSLLNETNRALEGRQLPSAVPGTAVDSSPAKAAAGVTVEIREFNFQGVTLLTRDELQRALASYTGTKLNFDGLRQAADVVANVYRAQGFLVRTFLPEQDLTSGIITIAVVEGKLSDVRVDGAAGAKRISEARARAHMLSRQKLGEPVRPEDLQRAISLLNDLPGVSATSVLEPGQKAGESQVVVAVKDTPMFTGNAQLDNTGNKATGEARATAGLNINSPLGIGDQVQIQGNKSTGAVFGRLSYSLPVGVDGARVSGSVTKLNYDYTQNATKFEGAATSAGLRVSYPVIRSNQANLNVGLGYDRKRFDNQVAAIEINNKQINVASLTVSGDYVDGFGGGGISQASLMYSRGKLDLTGNAADFTADQSAAGPKRHGDFSKLNLVLSRLQRITDVDTLLLSINAQAADRNLDSAEKIIVSGPFAVRSYSAGEASADEGTVASVEWQRQFAQGVQGIAFVDQANFRRDRNAFPASSAPNSYDLMGAGFGVNWNKPGDWSVRSTISWRLGENPARVAATGKDADGTKRDPRFYLTLIKFF